jgi:hypothetical protein
MRAGFARIHADQDARCGVLAIEIQAEGASDSVECGVVQRRLAGFSANAVGAEEFFGHDGKGGQLVVAAKRSS